MTFAEKLKQLRKQKNLTQENLASEILVSRTLITKYESGSVYPTEENLKRLADFFAVTTSELMPDDERISLTLKTANSIKTFKVCLTVIALLLSLTFVILLVLPIFDYCHPDGAFSSTLVFGTTSLLSALTKYKNPLAIISFVLCLLSSVYSVVLLFANSFKYEKVLRIVGAVIFGISLCLFILTFIYGAKIISSDNFYQNHRL